MYLIFIISHDDDYKRVTPSYTNNEQLFNSESDAKNALCELIYDEILQHNCDYENFNDEEMDDYFENNNQRLNKIKKKYYHDFEKCEMFYEHYASQCEFIDYYFDYKIKKIEPPLIV